VRGGRDAATLVEVLVSIFVMGIGLMALLVLFPLGAMRMAQAIQDQRASDSARNAQAIASFWQLRKSTNLVPTPASAAGDAFLSPPPSASPYPGVDPEGPTYPVFVDAIGYESSGTLWVGYAGALFPPVGAIPRRSTNFVRGNPVPGVAALRWFSLLDDLNFELDGKPKVTVPPSGIERYNLYSWAYLLQRPRSRDESVTHLSVVVYKQRPLSLTGGLTLPEYIYDTSYDTSTNLVILDYSATGVAPNLKSGDWILDSTPVTTVGAQEYYGAAVVPPALAPFAYRTAHGNFYRVVSATEVAGNKIEIEVQQPLRGFPPNQVTAGYCIFLEGVIEVFDKNTGWKSPPNPAVP
jgi:hypothetical protein